MQITIIVIGYNSGFRVFPNTSYNLYRQVLSLQLFLLLQLFQFTTQDDACVPPTIQQAAAQLNQSGGGPLGKFNKNYMAFTWKDVISNFNNLITQKSGNLSLAAAATTSSSFPVTRSIGGCTSSQSSFPYCNACPVVTDLGPGKFPRYINEVICQTELTICGKQAVGYCKTTSINQRLLMAQCDQSSGTETLVPFTQPIRSCCECFLF